MTKGYLGLGALAFGIGLVNPGGHSQITASQMPFITTPYLYSPGNFPATKGEIVGAEKLTDADTKELNAAQRNLEAAEIELKAAKEAVAKRHNMTGISTTTEIDGSYILQRFHLTTTLTNGSTYSTIDRNNE